MPDISYASMSANHSSGQQHWSLTADHRRNPMGGQGDTSPPIFKEGQFVPPNIWSYCMIMRAISMWLQIRLSFQLRKYKIPAGEAVDSVPYRNSCSLYAIILQIMRSCWVTMRTIRTEYEQVAQLDVREAKRLKKDCIFSRNLSVFLLFLFFIRSEFSPICQFNPDYFFQTLLQISM